MPPDICKHLHIFIIKNLLLLYIFIYLYKFERYRVVLPVAMHWLGCFGVKAPHVLFYYSYIFKLIIILLLFYSCVDVQLPW